MTTGHEWPGDRGQAAGAPGGAHTRDPRTVTRFSDFIPTVL